MELLLEVWLKLRQLQLEAPPCVEGGPAPKDKKNRTLMAPQSSRGRQAHWFRPQIFIQAFLGLCAGQVASPQKSLCWTSLSPVEG